jgi:hypothetical protein
VAVKSRPLARVDLEEHSAAFDDPALAQALARFVLARREELHRRVRLLWRNGKPDARAVRAVLRAPLASGPLARAVLAVEGAIHAAYAHGAHSARREVHGAAEDAHAPLLAGIRRDPDGTTSGS